MSAQSDTSTYDKFVLDTVFPDPIKVFGPPCPRLADLSADCLYVFDANALLAPFQLDIASDVCPIYQKLHDTKRLLTTKRSVQEFARNRQTVLAKAYQKIDKISSSLPSVTKPAFPFLQNTSEYTNLIEAGDALLAAKRLYLDSLNTLKDILLDWTWDDPISVIYRTAFTADTIVDHGRTREFIEEDLKHRIAHKIPPGYKDQSKDDDGIGDLLIWHSIIAAATQLKKHIVVVSNETKADWVVKIDHTPVGMRPELEYEFRHKTGQFVAIASYSRFLEINNAPVATIQKARSLEQVETYDFLLIQQRVSALLQDLSKIISAFLVYAQDADQTQYAEYVYIEDRSLEPLADALLSATRKYDKLIHAPAGMQILDDILSELSDIIALNRQLGYMQARMKKSGEIESVNLQMYCTRFMAVYNKWVEWYLAGSP